ncbi:hypothetical protein FJU08_01265 [Martelella alba]|uniref:Uncharacterized protein n=1 Tax=Martelella alba TaxID=2590451 RepID=A0A506UIY5_9HYPH|nr:hypothetical protein [Martelella alba]TPW33223.1 hypothetical protein FJU08_01265 [Martelella alba]
MTRAGAIITATDQVPVTARNAGPQAVRAFYQTMIDDMNAASRWLSAGGLVLTGHGYDRATGNVLLRGIATDGRGATIDDLRTIGSSSP